MGIWGRVKVISLSERLMGVGWLFPCEDTDRRCHLRSRKHALCICSACWYPVLDLGAVYKPLSLRYFVTVVRAEKTDEKWNNQQIKPEISQTSEKLLLCRELGYNSKCLLRCFLGLSSSVAQQSKGVRVIAGAVGAEVAQGHGGHPHTGSGFLGLAGHL